MVQSQNKFLDDLAKLASGAAGTLHGLRTEVEGMIRQRMERWAADLDLISREEFEAVKAMAAEARRENEDLRQRLQALELQQAGAAVGQEAGYDRPPFSDPPQDPRQDPSEPA